MVEKLSQRIQDGREPMEADKNACVNIFKAVKVTTTDEASYSRFCCRIRETGRPKVKGERGIYWRKPKTHRKPSTKK
jgi:hypothetical protein